MPLGPIPIPIHFHVVIWGFTPFSSIIFIAVQQTAGHVIML